MTDPQRPYNRFAKLYDRMDTGRYSSKMLDYTFRLLERYHFTPKRVLDLACGTGTAAVLMAKNGLEVTGLDRSKEMLKVARKKAINERVPVRYINQQLQNFEIISKDSKITEQFDLITCFYDSLNYLLKERELKNCFGQVAKHLRPGGYFVFDMNTHRALKHIWTKNINAGVEKDLAWVWNSEFDDDKKTANLKAVFFIKKGQHWERFEEMHIERAYPNSTIKKFLLQNGFQIKGLYRCFYFRKPTVNTGRIAVVAQRLGD